MPIPLPQPPKGGHPLLLRSLCQRGFDSLLQTLARFIVAGKRNLACIHEVSSSDVHRLAFGGVRRGKLHRCLEAAAHPWCLGSQRRFAPTTLRKCRCTRRVRDRDIFLTRSDIEEVDSIKRNWVDSGQTMLWAGVVSDVNADAESTVQNLSIRVRTYINQLSEDAIHTSRRNAESSSSLTLGGSS